LNELLDKRRDVDKNVSVPPNNYFKEGIDALILAEKVYKDVEGGDAIIQKIKK